MKLKWFFILVFISTAAPAQVFEAGVFVGGANTISDIGPSWYINPNSPAYGVLFKWNKSLRYTWRISTTHTNLIMDDAVSNIPARANRAYSNQTNLRDLTAGLEVNFKSFELHRFNASWTPYLFTGVSYYQYEDSYYENNTNGFQPLGRKYQFALPLIMGVKYKLAKYFVAALESGIRYSFNDNLDGSHPLGQEYEPYVFGNTASKDWYVFSGMTLTYTFGKKPCTQCYN
jgi:hypothetical protein